MNRYLVTFDVGTGYIDWTVEAVRKPTKAQARNILRAKLDASLHCYLVEEIVRIQLAQS